MTWFFAFVAAILAQSPEPQKVIHSTCAYTEGNNYGIFIQGCVPTLRYTFPSTGPGTEEVRQLPDGTFQRELQYRATEKSALQMRVCSPDLVDFSIVSDAGFSYQVNMPAASNDCIEKQFLIDPSNLKLVVRTTRRDAQLQVSTIILPISAAAANNLATPIPIFIPPPPPPPPPPPAPPPPPP